jgi:tRNA dimethylallyltransferase
MAFYASAAQPDTRQMSTSPRVVAVVGTNASGKSDLAVHLAEVFRGEVVSADSRQVFRELDLCAGKLAAEEMRGIPHHLIDITEVGQPFSVADFQRLAYQAVDSILQRGRLPIIAGGTGLYVRAVVEGFDLHEGPSDPLLRKELEARELGALVDELLAAEPDAGARVDLRNPRRVVRAVEIVRMGGTTARRVSQPLYDVLQVGLTWPRPVLYQRIDQRLARRLEHGMIQEVRRLLESGVPPGVLDSLGLEYRHILRFIQGEYGTLEELYNALRFAIHAFARRQITWFRKAEGIAWLDSTGDYPAEAERLISDFLAGRRPEAQRSIDDVVGVAKPG